MIVIFIEKGILFLANERKTKNMSTYFLLIENANKCSLNIV